MTEREMWLLLQEWAGVDQDGVPGIVTARGLLHRAGIAVPTPATELTPRIVAFCASEEGLVREAYLDSEGVWTWALGVTNASGHTVHPRYLDNVQSLDRCIDVSLWLMRKKYLPAVLEAFEGHDLTEAQLAGALSFHWNTGAIGHTEWVTLWKHGNAGAARRFLTTHYLNGGVLEDRRKREAALFFDGVWPADMRVPVYPVRKPAYTPDWGRVETLDLLPILQERMG